MDNRQLLIDTITFDVNPSIIREALANNERLMVSGIIQRADALNQNKRLYPKNILMRETSKYDHLVKERRSLGELDHPESSVINLANVSHIITELHWEGNNLMGTIEVLPTPSGNILKALFGANVKVGISSRGLGSVKEIGEGAVEVQEDFEILCWDMVSNPSTQGSFMQPIHEGINKRLTKKDSIIIQSKYDKINETIRGIFSNLNYDCGKDCKWDKI